jgi:hypothetical protein
MEELKEALKNQKIVKLSGEGKLNSEIYKYVADPCNERLLFFHIYMMGEMPEECRKSIVIPVHKEGDKQKVENYREISLLNACYEL